MHLSEATVRVYAGAQNAFHLWRKKNRVRFPASHEAVAAYLQDVSQRSVASVPVHFSAIAHLYRDAGKSLDSQAPAIKAVIGRARLAMRPAVRNDNPRDNRRRRGGDALAAN